MWLRSFLSANSCLSAILHRYLYLLSGLHLFLRTAYRPMPFMSTYLPTSLTLSSICAYLSTCRRRKVLSYTTLKSRTSFTALSTATLRSMFYSYIFSSSDPSTTRFKRFAVYLVDHSDPDRGDLHFAPGNQGASPVLEVRNCTTCGNIN
jgi:hypothetical protein